MCDGSSSGSAGGLDATPDRPDVDSDGGDDQDALDDALPVGRDDENVQPVVEGLDQQQTQGGAPDAAATTEQARPADDDRGDGVELVPLAEVGRTGDHAGGQHHAGQAGEQTAERIDTEKNSAGLHAGDLSRNRV